MQRATASIAAHMELAVRAAAASCSSYPPPAPQSRPASIAGSPSTRNLTFVRADISTLPFASCSIGAIHAGAANHSWPSPSNTVGKISRVLRPGSVFVGTTFLSSPTNCGLFSVDSLRPLRQIVRTLDTNYNFVIEGELEVMCSSWWPGQFLHVFFRKNP